MVYTVRLAGIGRRGGRNGFERQLHDSRGVQKNSRPNHPTTCGKVERFQQTMKKWLRAQPHQPATLAELQACSTGSPGVQPAPTAPTALPHPATRPPGHPAALYDTMPKAVHGPSRDADSHDRVRHDRVDKSGTVILRVQGQLRQIGVGRTHKKTHVILLVQALDVRIVNAITGELLRELTIDTNRDYQPRI